MLVASAAAMFGTLSYISRGADGVGMGALPFVWWRGALGTAVLLAAVGAMTFRARVGGHGVAMWVPRGADRTRLAIACLLGSYVNIAMFAAFNRTTIAVVLISFYTFPAIVTLLAVRFYGERLNPVRVGALILSATGLVLVVLSPLLGATSVNLDPLGIGLALSSALCQASFILIAGRGFGVSTTRQATYVLFAAGVAALALAVVTGDFAGLTVPFRDAQAWIWVLVGGIWGAAIPTTAFLGGIGLIGPSRAAILMTIEPLVGVTVAAVLLGEHPSPLQVVGGVAVLAAAIILQLAPRHVAAEPEFRPLV